MGGIVREHMATKAIKREVSGDRQVNSLQRSIAKATAQLRNGPFGDGNEVDNIVLKAGVPQAVNHGLGRAVRGWVRLREQGVSATAGVVEVASDPTRSVTLLAGNDVTLNIFFF